MLIHNDKKAIPYILVVIILAILTCVISVLILSDNVSILVSEGSMNELMEAENYEITVQTNAKEVSVYINNKQFKTIFVPKSGSLAYNTSDAYLSGRLHEGWNYIQFKAKKPFVGGYTSAGAAINIISNGPDVYVTDNFLYDARRWNRENHYAPDYYEEFFEKYNYSWKAQSLNGHIFTNSESIKLDDNGIPTVDYYGDYYYNPVTIAQNGLGWYDRYLSNGDNQSLNAFITAADWFVKNQRENGSFPYSIPFSLKQNLKLPEGFVSGMAQGQVLSLLVRAYDVTQEDKYLKAGESALIFCTQNVNDDIFNGCFKSLEDFTCNSEELKKFSTLRLPEEYVSTPSSYVMNGDMIATIGLYDWWKGAPDEYGSEIAKEALYESIEAIKVLLPYYDYYGWTSYDLLQYTYDSFPSYSSEYAHRIYIEYLHALYMITGDKELLHWRDVFLSYETDDFWRQTDIIYRRDMDYTLIGTN